MALDSTCLPCPCLITPSPTPRSALTRTPTVWSFCNEYECEQEDAPYSGQAFRKAAKGVDPSRPVTANGGADPDSLDVQGFSHKKNSTFVSFHKSNPNKASVLSECCSCTSQRDSRSLPSCIAQENSPGLLPYVSGSLGVWTLVSQTRA